MWDLDYKESWVPKNWCFWNAVLEKTLDSPLDWKEIQPVHPKGDQSWVFIGRTDAEAKTPILGHLMWRADSLEKTLILGKIEGRRRRGWQVMRCLDDIKSQTRLSNWTELNWTELNFEKIEHQGSFSICLGVHDYKQRHCNSETIQLSSIALRSTDTKTFTGYQQTESCKR